MKTLFSYHSVAMKKINIGLSSNRIIASLIESVFSFSFEQQTSPQIFHNDFKKPLSKMLEQLNFIYIHIHVNSIFEIFAMKIDFSKIGFDATQRT